MTVFVDPEFDHPESDFTISFKVPTAIISFFGSDIFVLFIYMLDIMQMQDINEVESDPETESDSENHTIIETDQPELFEDEAHESGHRKPVVCIETGEVFYSAYSAAKALGWTGLPTIGDCCKDMSKTAAGYHWARYVE